MGQKKLYRHPILSDAEARDPVVMAGQHSCAKVNFLIILLSFGIRQVLVYINHISVLCQSYTSRHQSTKINENVIICHYQ